MNDLESDDESVDTPLVYPFPHSDNDSNDGEVLNELIEYENVGMLRREKAINSFDGDDLEFQCMIGFRKVVAYFDPFLPMNIITRKAYKTIMVEGLESTESKNLVVVVRDVYVFVGSFTYITDFVVLEDIGEFIQINKAEVVMGFYAVLSSDLTNKIACRKFLIKNGEEIFTDAGDGVRTKKYVELSATEKLQADYDMNVINIILQGLPTEILFTCNSHRVAKDYGKKVQLLMQENEMHSDSNIILYSQYLIESQNAAVSNDNLIANETLSAELERYKERVILLEERQNMELGTREKLIIDDIIREKNAQFADFEKEIFNLKQTLSEQSKEKELLTKTFNVFKNESKEKEAKNIDTEIALEKKVKELDNIVCKMGQSAQKTLMLEEESRSKIFLKQSDLMVLEKKVNTKPIDYAELNRLSKDFVKRFVPQQELSDEQASHPIIDQYASLLVEIKAPRELSKMEAAIQQFHVHKQCFEIQKKQFLFENDRLLDQIISQDIVNIVMNSLLDENTPVNVNSFVAMNDSVNYVEMCNKCLELEDELIKQHNMVEKYEYNRLSKRFSELEQHCISLELAMQLNKEFFQKNNTSVNQNEPLFDQLFELNNLKDELEAKDTTIKKLKAHIKRVNETSTSESVKKDLDEIETINIELEHRSLEISDLNAQLEEKVFVITALKNDLRKLKGKDIVDNAAQMSNAATIAPGMYKLDPVILAPKVKNNREAHEYYLQHTMEQAVILREIIQELLGYIRDTCPDIHKPSEKLVVVMPINKKKIVQFGNTVTSSGNISKVTNRPLLSSTRVNPSTSASGSKPSGNIKNDRIQRTPSSNEKNKVEVQSRKVKSSLNKRNCESKNVCNKHVKHPVRGAKALCSVYIECLFDANYAMCLINHVNSINVRGKSVSKKNKKRKEWKPTRKVFNSIIYKWNST
ncbi:hypothetical protein Tco_0768503 [Tanacetum coccineum]